MDWYFYLVKITQLVLTVGGIAFLIAVRRRSPRAARFGVVGLCALLLGQVVELWFFDLWWAMQVKLGMNDRVSLRGVQTLMNVLIASGIGLVVWAIGLDRRQATPGSDPLAQHPSHGSDHS